jgi:hypothetical protein
VQKGTSRRQRQVLLPIHVPIILSRTWVTWLQNASSTKKALNLQIFPFFVSPNRTIIHYNKRAICICILLSIFVKASVRRNKRKRHRRNAVRRLEIHATPSLAEPAWLNICADHPSSQAQESFSRPSPIFPNFCGAHSITRRRTAPPAHQQQSNLLGLHLLL